MARIDSKTVNGYEYDKNDKIKGGLWLVKLQIIGRKL